MLITSSKPVQSSLSMRWSESRRHRVRLSCLLCGTSLFYRLCSFGVFVYNILILSKGVCPRRESDEGYPFLKVHRSRDLAESLHIVTVDRKAKEPQWQEEWPVPWCTKDEQVVFLGTSGATSQLGSIHHKDQTRKQSKASFDQNVPTSNFRS